MQVSTTGVGVSAEEAHALQGNVNKFYLFRFFVDFQLWLPIWAVYLTDLRGLSLTQLTLLDAPFWILLIVLEVPTGAIADRWGRKVSLSYGALTNAIAVVVFGVAAHFGILLVSYMVWAVAWTLYSGADSAFVYDSLKAGGRENDYQKLWGRTRAVQASAAIAGLLLGAPLADFAGLEVPVVASGGLMAVAWIVSFSFREPPRAQGGEENYLATIKEAFGVAFRRPAVRMMILMMSTITGIGVSMIILQQPFLSSHDVRYAFFGFILTPGQLLSIGGALLAYRLVHTLGVSGVLVLMPIAMLTTALGLGFVDHVGAFAFYPLTTLAFAMSFVVMSDYLNRRIPSANRATILSIQSMIFSLVVAGVEPLLGWIGDEWSLLISYRTTAIVLVTAGVPLFLLWLREHRRETFGGSDSPDSPEEPDEP